MPPTIGALFISMPPAIVIRKYTPNHWCAIRKYGPNDCYGFSPEWHTGEPDVCGVTTDVSRPGQTHDPCSMA